MVAVTAIKMADYCYQLLIFEDDRSNCWHFELIESFLQSPADAACSLKHGGEISLDLTAEAAGYEVCAEDKIILEDGICSIAQSGRIIPHNIR